MGDFLAGVAATSLEERVAAQMTLAAVPLARFLDDALVPYESDEVTRGRVKVKEAQAEAAAAMSNVAFKVGDLGDTMKTVEDVLNKRYEQSAGKARLAKDMVDSGALREKEAESKALEQNALAEFLASQGIASAPAATDAPPPPKTSARRPNRTAEDDWIVVDGCRGVRMALLWHTRSRSDSAARGCASGKIEVVLRCMHG